MVVSFKYFGRVLTASDENWPAAVSNLRKVQKRWVQLSKILGREGDDPWTSGNFYEAVLQATLLFGTETWAISPSIGKSLGSSTPGWPVG